jgi:hypothetical protein
MPPFRISARIDNPRFKVTFDDDDAVCYCNSVKSLAVILRDNGRDVDTRDLYATVGPDDRRPPYLSAPSFIDGATITRLTYLGSRRLRHSVPMNPAVRAARPRAPGALALIPPRRLRAAVQPPRPESEPLPVRRQARLPRHCSAPLT